VCVAPKAPTQRMSGLPPHPEIISPGLDKLDQR
jgi:hypothetical protein